MKLSGWGRFPVLDCRVETPRDETALRALLGERPLIARGAGRSYGDSALNEGLTISTARFNRMLAFDAETGALTVEAGVVLGDVIGAFLPRGWFPSVTPGTKFVTIGGMIAADVHGKNHHGAGSFGAHVLWFDLMTADGSVLRCSPDRNPQLFRATIGGMGLTGVILRVAFRMVRVESAWIRQETIAAFDLDATMAAFEASQDWTYTVAWIDCLSSGKALGRSLVYRGEHARLDELDDAKRGEPFRTPENTTKRVPFNVPSWTLNRWSVRAFNVVYYWNGRRRPREHLVDWDSYFYPLDTVLGWNRIYGRRGFVQFQCVIPLKASRKGIAALLRETAASGQGSFLAVLKLLGPQESTFSFPMVGYTLALDFPVTQKALALLERLDRITLDHGGRFYLAKDARMQRQTFTASDPRGAAFRALRMEIGAASCFTSAQSERLAL